MSLFLRNLLFTILQPGMVAGVVPLWIERSALAAGLVQPWGARHVMGAAAAFIGSVVLVKCIADFAVRGRGTLSPADPTQKLVHAGLYRYSRNPMYIGVMLILLGEALFFWSYALAIYSVLIFIAFNVFIVHFEEPRLRKDFGADYKAYTEQTRRWL